MIIFEQLKNFSASEFNHPEKIDVEFLKIVQEFRDFVNKPIIIHSDFRTNSQRHASGKALDFRVVGMNVLDMYLSAERFGKFKGIGIYPNWNNPGLHVDIHKPGRWLAYNSGGRQLYVALNAENLKRYVISTI